MSIRQAKLIRIAAQHDRAAHAMPDSDRAVEVAVPYTLFDAFTHEQTGSGTDWERVSTVEELLASLGY